MKMDGDLCKVGGQDGNNPNYNRPHVAGAVYLADGSQIIATNCVFCGREIEQ